MRKKLVSIIISAYNEEGNLVELYKQLLDEIKSITNIDFEFIFVNDGSVDDTLLILRALASKDHRVRIVNFSRNFGHEVAMTAGLDYSRGDAVIFMDADLQHPPKLIPQMIEKWLQGHDIVLTKIISIQDKSWLRNIFSLIFYKITNLFSEIKIPPRTPDFRLIGKKYIDALKDMRESSRMFRGMLNWLGLFNYAEISFDAPKRFSGKSNYNLSRSFSLAVDSILQFSIKPLRLSIYLSIACALLSLGFGAWTIYEHFKLHQPSGYATIICLISGFSSLQFIILGIIGEYIGRIHIESKSRPLYFAELIEHKNMNSE